MWDKAAEIGRQFDPANPLFQKGMKEGTANSGKLDAVAPAAAATVAVSAVAAAEPILTTTVEEQAVNTSNNIDFSLGEDEGDLFVESTSFAESPQAEDSNLTFDTNFSNTQSGIKPLAEAPKVEETFESKSDEQAVEISFDLPSDVKVSSPAVDMPEISQAEDSTVEAGSLDSDDDDNVVDLTKTAFDGSLLDFDLDIETGESRAQSASSALDDLGFGESPAKNALKEEVEAEIGLETSFDHAGAETLAKGLSGEVEVASEAAPSDLDVPNEEVQTKLELAKAYKNMGEADDARELLQEILTEGSSSQKSEAKSLLASL